MKAQNNITVKKTQTKQNSQNLHNGLLTRQTNLNEEGMLKKLVGTNQDLV